MKNNKAGLSNWSLEFEIENTAFDPLQMRQ